MGVDLDPNVPEAPRAGSAARRKATAFSERRLGSLDPRATVSDGRTVAEVEVTGKTVTMSHRSAAALQSAVAAKAVETTSNHRWTTASLRTRERPLLLFATTPLHIFRRLM